MDDWETQQRVDPASSQVSNPRVFRHPAPPFPPSHDLATQIVDWVATHARSTIPAIKDFTLTECDRAFHDLENPLRERLKTENRK
jgi:hypothetical protein